MSKHRRTNAASPTVLCGLLLFLAAAASAVGCGTLTPNAAVVQFGRTVSAAHRTQPDASVEVLTPAVSQRPDTLADGSGRRSATGALNPVLAADASPKSEARVRDLTAPRRRAPRLIGDAAAAPRPKFRRFNVSSFVIPPPSVPSPPGTSAATSADAEPGRKAAANPAPQADAAPVAAPDAAPVAAPIAAPIVGPVAGPAAAPDAGLSPETPAP